MAAFSLLYQTAKVFGPVGGGVIIIAMAAAKLRPSSGLKTTRLMAKGYPQPIFVRLRTSDRSVLRQILIDHEYKCPSEKHNKALQAFYENALSRSKIPVIIDCGANIGLAALWYSRSFPHARIIAVEPEPENFRILTMNVAGYSNITAVHGAVSDRRTRVSLSNGGVEPWSWETTEANDGDVETHTIPSLKDSLPDSELMIVKIDIEGGEVALFRSNAAWVTNTPLIVFEAHDRWLVWRGTFHAVASVLTKHARDYIQTGENTFSFSHALLSPRRAGGEKELHYAPDQAALVR